MDQLFHELDPQRLSFSRPMRFLSDMRHPYRRASLPVSNQKAPGPVRFSSGQQIGPYRLLEVLGRGAFGEVWLAERASAIVKTRCALKLALDAMVDLKAIRREGELWMRGGSHPNILPLFEADLYGGQVAIASEYSPDGSLARWLVGHRGKAPTVEAAIEMTMGILAGLEHLHVRGIIHRDLKPQNILMQADVPRLADFGLARVAGQSATAGGCGGTVAYMAPEAFNGQRSVQTDIWSVGIILYQMLTGRFPFPEKEAASLMKSIITRAPGQLPLNVPKGLKMVVSKALQKEPARRFPSAADMRAELRETLRQIEPRAAPTLSPSSSKCMTIAITGTMEASPLKAAQTIGGLVAPYLGDYTTWYVGSFGVVDETAAELLLKAKQRVIVFGYCADDISEQMEMLVQEYGAPFVDVQAEMPELRQNLQGARVHFLLAKADLMILIWDGQSTGTESLVNWLRSERKDHIIGFI